MWSNFKPLRFITQQHRQGDIVLNDVSNASLYQEVKDAISGISDQDIRTRHEVKFFSKMSLSYAINDLLRERFVAKGWMKEAPIFQQEGFEKEKKWRLDFAKESIAIEVAFNHGEAIAESS